jgi:futalosine hydrolase
MKTLVVSATPMELNLILLKAQKVKSKQTGLCTYNLDGKIFDVLITGVGMVATSFRLGRVLLSNNYDRIINAGIAGSFDKSIPLGTVVEIVEDQFSEMGAEDGAKFIPLSDLDFPLDDALPETITDFINRQGAWDLSYPKLRAITVNTVHGSEDRIKITKHRFNPQVESMEGAAFFYACKMADVSCIQIRAISNYVERRNRASWDIPGAVKNLNQEIMKLLSL